MAQLLTPAGYKPLLDLQQTELAIKKVKDFFESCLSAELKLRRVTAPLFVLKGRGINDDLNGVERPVSFPIKDFGDQQAEVVHSLAKWKRLTLADYKIPAGYGIYTDMNAIRPDEELDNLHSLYVDQWDWERSINIADRNIDFLKDIVRRIYSVLLKTEYIVYEAYPQIKGKKLILYAPTFRGSVSKAKAPDQLDIRAMAEALSDDYVLLISITGSARSARRSLKTLRTCSHLT